MALIDEVVIRVQSGAGGNGCVSFRREKYIPFGGPNGGSGGRGGNVYFVATRDKTSLLDFRYQPRYQAERGEHGKGKDMDGRGGEDLFISIPTGTLVYDVEENYLLGDLLNHGETLLVAKGGRGGRGNMCFTSSTNRAPRRADPGEAPEVKELRLELRLIADVGLIGLPNAGKSSFLARVTRATPKVADYPFTTLEPHLGVVSHKDRGFVLSDLPGLIEGASQGAGLGHLFLRHVSRNRLLLHFVDINAAVDEIARNVAIIRQELRAYNAEVSRREQWLVFTKTDCLDPDALGEKLTLLKSMGLKGWPLSSHSGAGVEALLDAVATKSLEWEPPPVPVAPSEPSEERTIA